MQAIHLARPAVWGALITMGAALSCSNDASDAGAAAGSAGASGSSAAFGQGGGAPSPGGAGNAGSTSLGGVAAGSSAFGGQGGSISAGNGSTSAGNGSTSAGNGGHEYAGSAGDDAGGAPTGSAGVTGYDELVLADEPVGYWAVNQAPNQEPDLSGHGHAGAYRGKGTPAAATLPNGDSALAFDGVEQYLTIASSASFSIPTTGYFSWEAWMRPDVLQFPNDDSTGSYVDWLGKCEEYGPTCEWEARFYNTNTSEDPNRPNRFSAYVFNPSAGLGSGADWQPSANVIVAGHWYHVIGQYTTEHAPSDCKNTDAAPGSIDIWLNGVKWAHASHGQTGCMSQYDVVPKANDSAVNVGTMAKESFFKGAIGKVAFYDHALTQAQIDRHYTAMTGEAPHGSCGNTCSF